MKDLDNDFQRESNVSVIMEYNFTDLKKLIRIKEPNMEYEKVEAAEIQYKEYLILNLYYPNERLVPTKLADFFWHYHILDTRDYCRFTNTVFGKYLHHNPYLGIEPEGKALLEVLHTQTIEKRKTLPDYVRFQEYASVSSDCDNDGSGGESMCGSSCYNK